MRKVLIRSPYITLGQLLKFTNLVGSGGEEKFFLSEHEVKVNGIPDNRRGRKIYPGDVVEINDGPTFQIGKEHDR